MSINDLPSDLIILICNEVINEDNTNKEIKKCKKTILDIIAERNLIILPVADFFPHDEDGKYIEEDTDSEIITDIVSNHVASLSKTQKDTIICDYGIINAIMLYHNFNVIGCGNGKAEFYYELTNPEYNIHIIDEIIILIINDEIKYNYDWRNNGSKKN